jgi:hypothetical protein
MLWYTLATNRKELTMARVRPITYAGNPFIVFGRRPYREQRIRAYLLREHRRGRRLGEILSDPYLARLGSPARLWRTVVDPLTIGALERHIREAIQTSTASIDKRDKQEEAKGRGSHGP